MLTIAEQRLNEVPEHLVARVYNASAKRIHAWVEEMQYASDLEPPYRYMQRRETIKIHRFEAGAKVNQRQDRVFRIVHHSSSPPNAAGNVIVALRFNAYPESSRALSAAAAFLLAAQCCGLNPFQSLIHKRAPTLSKARIASIGVVRCHPIHRGETIIFRNFKFGTHFEWYLKHIYPVFQYRQMQRSVTVTVSCLDVGSRVDQRPSRIHGTPSCRPLQRSIAPIIPCFKIFALFDQCQYRLCVIFAAAA